MPYTLNGAILAATGGPTVNEGQLAWFQSHGAAGFTNYNDAERKFLLVATGEPVNTPKTNADLWRDFLKTGGWWPVIGGDINEAMRAYWVQQANAAPDVVFTGNPLQVTSGGSCLLTWNIEGATSASASAVPANPQWTGAKAATGSVNITSLTQSTVFTLTAIGPGGTTVVNVDVEVVGQFAAFEMTVGQDATPDYFGYNNALYGAVIPSPLNIFGGTLTVLVGAWNGIDQILVFNGGTGSPQFPDIGTAQLELFFPAGGPNSGPFILTFDGTYYSRADSALAYYLNTKVGQTIDVRLTKI